MLTILIRLMIYLGSALMVYNIYGYIRYARDLQKKEKWEGSTLRLYIPIILLVMFLLGYLFVGILGDPDLIVAGILFGGSVFVFIILLWIRFITQKIQEKEKLEAELLAVEKSNNAKNLFLSGISHEMRTPMNAIIGLDTIALKNPDLDPETKNLLEKIGVSARYLQSLINDILDMSLFESGEISAKKEEFSLNGVIENACVLSQSLCEGKGLSFRNEITGKLDDYYIGDGAKLSQALISVLGNAVKFTNAPGTVTFTVEQIMEEENIRHLRFVISDTGVGISEEFLPKIFEPFSREDLSNTTSYGGSGLGLSLTKRLVEAMGGKISAVSAKGHGSIFTIEVPFEKSDRKNDPESVLQDDEQKETYRETLRGKCVLVADDIDLNAEIVSDLLDLEEVVTERAENGQEAVSIFANSPVGHFDAILMDLRMPVMDGFEAAKRIRSLDRADALTVPILALTANAFEEDKKHSLESGMNIHMTKPVDADELYVILGKCIYNAQKKRG